MMQGMLEVEFDEEVFVRDSYGKQKFHVLMSTTSRSTICLT